MSYILRELVPKDSKVERRVKQGRVGVGIWLCREDVQVILERSGKEWELAEKKKREARKRLRKIPLRAFHFLIVTFGAHLVWHDGGSASTSLFLL
jgi:hypothetical protein